MQLWLATCPEREKPPLQKIALTPRENSLLTPRQMARANSLQLRLAPGEEQPLTLRGPRAYLQSIQGSLEAVTPRDRQEKLTGRRRRGVFAGRALDLAVGENRDTCAGNRYTAIKRAAKAALLHLLPLTYERPEARLLQYGERCGHVLHAADPAGNIRCRFRLFYRHQT